MTSTSKLMIRQAAVLGAGVMGAQIAGFLIAAGIPVKLFDLATEEQDKSSIAKAAIKRLQKLKPAPLTNKRDSQFIQACNYQEDLEALRDCDFIIEAIGEKLEWKNDLYRKISPFINEHAVLATNTSGLSINLLAESLPSELRSRFCGVHFFNPPRYMKLVELTANLATEPAILTQLEAFLVTTLGKGVVYAKDTPNFIGNRIGVFSLLATLHHAEKFGLGFEVVDALTGPIIGRAKSATFRTADVVGLDVFAHVVATMTEYLPNDPWHQCYQLPEWFMGLIAKGALGQKNRCRYLS